MPDRIRLFFGKLTVGAGAVLQILVASIAVETISRNPCGSCCITRKVNLMDVDAELKLFLHMPKCAGTTIKNWLSLNMSSAVRFDYESYFKIPRLERNTSILKKLNEPESGDRDKIIFGHFFPIKYFGTQKPKNCKLVTIIRDPIDRIFSHYRYWSSGSFPDHYLWRIMIEKRWSLEEFAFCDEMQNFYSQHLIQVPLGSFDYVGLFEDFEKSASRCFEVLGIDQANGIGLQKVNISKGVTLETLDGNVLKKLKQHHADDYLIYEYVRERYHGG